MLAILIDMLKDLIYETYGYHNDTDEIYYDESDEIIYDEER